MYRIARIIIHTLIGLIMSVVCLPFISHQRKLKLIKWWCVGLLNAFQLPVTVFGQLPPVDTKGVMFVANHISWADIHALNSQIPLRFIAKSEIKSWPIFGYLAQKANTLFIDRGRLQLAGEIVRASASSLLNGDNLCFFPEGTTTDGKQVLPFKSSVLQSAITANTRIWPVAIRYVNADGSINANLAYAGDTTLSQSLLQAIKQKNATVQLHFLMPIDATNQNRRDLSQMAYHAIVSKLQSYT